MSNAQARAVEAYHLGNLMAQVVMKSSYGDEEGEYEINYALDHTRKAVHSLTTEREFNTLYYQTIAEMHLFLDKWNIDYDDRYSPEWWYDVYNIESVK